MHLRCLIKFPTHFSDLGDDVQPVGCEGRCPGLGSAGLALGGGIFRDASLGEESG